MLSSLSSREKFAILFVTLIVYSPPDDCRFLLCDVRAVVMGGELPSVVNDLLQMSCYRQHHVVTGCTTQVLRRGTINKKNRRLLGRNDSMHGRNQHALDRKTIGSACCACP